MKKTILPILTLAVSLACGSAEAVEGDIWQIFPCDRYGTTVDRSSITSDDTVPAGSNIYFKVRLISKGNDYTPYHIAGTGATSTNTSINPPRICLYVSGQPAFADYIGELEYGSGSNKHFTDVIFCYTPKVGDFAMPVKLGTASGPASDLYKEDIAYFFDPLTSWMWEWASTNKKTGEERAAVANWWFFNGDPLTRDEPGRTSGLDYSLAECHYYIKTVDFDSEWESATVWRSVHQGSDTIKVGPTPSLVASSAVAEQKTFYVWSEDDEIVKVAGPNMSLREVRPGMWRQVATVVMDGGQTLGQSSAKFEIFGVDEFKQTKLIMSAYPKYTISDATGAVETDYVIVPVACVEKLPPTIRIVPESTKVVASSNYTYYVTELCVTFTQIYDRDVTLTVTPSLEASALLDWKDYIAIYDEKTLDIAVAAATNTVYTIPAGSLVPMENGAQKRIYLFALRGDENTINAKHLQFTASTENLQAHADITGWDTPTGLININPAKPVISEPAEGDATLTAVAGADRTLRIKVDSMYADQNVVSNGYQIFIIKNTDTETMFEPVGGEMARYVPGQGGYLYLTNAAGKASDKLPSVVYSVTDPELNKSILKVVSPISGLESDERHFSVTVSAPAGYTVNVIDDEGKVVQVPKYNEGEGGTIRIQLDRANDTGASLYAFLKPANEDSKAAIQCGFLAADDNYGLEIQKFSTATADSFVMIDGRGAANSSFKYTVELRTAPLYQDGVPVTSYQCKNTLVITSLNVIPTIEKILLGLDETQLDPTSGKWVFPELVVAKGIKQTFTASVLEPGITDLNATGGNAFKTRWRFSTTGITTKAPDNADDKVNGIIYGDPDVHKAEFTFTKAGEWKVVVDCRDKDMSDFGTGEVKKTFVFYVTVVDQPAITVTGHYLTGSVLTEEVTTFNETDSEEAEGNACLNVALGFNKCDFPLVVQLTVTPPGADGENRGLFELREISGVSKYMGGGVYQVTFQPGETSVVIPIKSLDGTKLSRSAGFTLTTKMLTDEPCPETGDEPKSTKDYYVGSSKTIKVANVPPIVDEMSIYPMPLSTNVTAIGTVNTITWDFSDVKGDFINDFSGVIVEVTVPGGEKITREVTDPNATEGSCEFKLSESGLNIVRISFRDKDSSAASSFIIYYDVTPSKTLSLIPHGPTTGLSGMYADVYGEGRVYAAGEDTIVREFFSKFNCGLAKVWMLYAYGYKVGDVEGQPFRYPSTHNPTATEMDAYYPDRNNPIDKNGNGNAAGGYAYSHEGNRNCDVLGNPADSFLYAWVKKSTSKDAQEGTYSVLAYKPEAPLARDAGTEVSLPTEELDDGTYDNTTVEAVFSLEYLSTDNMGDINFDGIPDAWFVSLPFTSSTPLVNLVTGLSGTSTEAVDDTTKVHGYNDDEDFLPDLVTSGQSYMLDYTQKRKFTALLELRGYNDTGSVSALNDAPNNNGYMRLTGYKPDRLYCDPDTCPTSTLSKVEFLAWQEFAAANGLKEDDPASWENWSPENPTDPTKDDTDEDGLDDGTEYVYWYRAHVGFYENGRHTYLTGRRFNPRNPGDGDFLSSEYIKSVMNPTVPLATASALLDSDNDGLPDFLEFELQTNPFDFDTDGDGVPDGYEVLVAGTNPRKPSTDGSTTDGNRNYDGDHMAWTTVYHVGGGVKNAKNNDCLEYTRALEDERPIDTIAYYTTFAVEDPNGFTDGVQWYAVSETTEVEVEISEEPEGQGVTFSFYDEVEGWVDAMMRDVAPDDFAAMLVPEKSEIRWRLGRDLTKTEAFLYETNETGVVIGEGIRVPCGTELFFSAEDEAVDYYTMSLATKLEFEDCNAAWPYYGTHSDKITVSQVGSEAILALGRHWAPAKGARIVASPRATRPVALMHYYVYQAYGFDPRTAWNSTTPLALRWGKSESDSDAAVSGVIKSGTKAGLSARTKPYTTRDECLVMSFLLNAGCAIDESLEASSSTPWAKIFAAYTTNPRGLEETTLKYAGAVDETGAAAETTATAETVSGNGADTDEDGVPDGWELYVMGGPKKKGSGPKKKDWFTQVFIKNAHGYESEIDRLPGAPKGVKAHMSPWDGVAKNESYTDAEEDQDFDFLSEWHEFAGTDSCAAYADVSTTIVRPSEHAKWINKFFPTDPWARDTDGDGLNDNYEFTGVPLFPANRFVYGTPENDDSLWSIPGGGLNPCSVDTDRDGLPDAWEAQFAGSKVYDGEFMEKLRKGNTKSGNPSWGLIDGMDGTVADAYTQPNQKDIVYSYESADGLTNWSVRIVTPNRDYDHDGLENWQEYITGAMRCWRYDDPYTRWDALSGNSYTNENGVLDIEKACAEFGFADENEFWFRTLADKTSPYYNPRFVFDTNPGAVYWSRVTNAWDLVYSSGGGAYYIFYHRSGADHLQDLWGKGMGLDETLFYWFPQRYACCSPLEADTDQDGMDDYYELFHGLNPLLGMSGVRQCDKGPYDVIFDVWYKEGVGSPHSAEENWWTGKTTICPPKGDMDFEAYPFLAGSATADPDGDDIRNLEEALMPENATATWHHTDPTPVWMTDTSYSNSYVRLFYRMPTNPMIQSAPEGSFTSLDEKPVTYYFRDCDGYICSDTDVGPLRMFTQSRPDHWSLSEFFKPNWLFSFEENEGYDSDHDGLGDHEELEGKFRVASDPIDADSPRRRQAMYFQGPSRPSLLMTMPQVKEKSPFLENEYPDDPSFLQYTVECWAYPESTEDATLVERAVWAAPSNMGDEEFLRCNFQLAIKDGKWYTKFDPRGTERGNQVESFSSDAVEANRWTHLAATYDGKSLILYVNGKAEVAIGSGLQPEYGTSAVALKANRSYAFDREYPLHAILVGASAKTQAEGAADGLHLNVLQNEKGLAGYDHWFKGYLDEIRIWDGARTASEIIGTMKTRYTAELAKKNREEFYDQWATRDETYPNGRRRYAKDKSGVDCDVVAELRYHYAFDSVFAAENEQTVAKEPHGFGENGVKAPVSRPEGYSILWWSDVLAHYAGTVYNSPRWVTWVPNTVTHLPRFDGTTLDSYYWSDDFKGDVEGSYKFARSAEPVSLWTQMIKHRVVLSPYATTAAGGATSYQAYRTTGTRHHLVNGIEGSSQHYLLFDFTGRHLNQSGDDLLPLGGAYVKYFDDHEKGMWDEQGASTTWEITGNDADNDGLPDWWETYADENYRRVGDTPFGSLDWGTLIDYHGNIMTAGAAYMRDLARGFYADESGEVVEGPTKFRQTYDENANGIPDWWEDIYRLTDQNPLADSDNDGLPNYLEYMLSEVFDLGGRLFNPVRAYSVDKYVPDYFFRLGSLYVGDVFTDHDLVDDAWEDQYEDTFATRLSFDAFADKDEDGWCNRSESRYSKQCSPLVANNQTHYDSSDKLFADYPVPTLTLTLRYNGARPDAVRTAPIIVQVTAAQETTDPDEVRDPDATYTIGEIKNAETSSRADQKSSDGSTAYYKTLGMWSDRHAIGTLTPGNVNMSSLTLDYCADPSSMTYHWMVDSTTIWYDSGTAADYAEAQRKYGKAFVTLLDKTSDYETFSELVKKTSETGETMTWTCSQNGKVLGTVNLKTGSYDLDLGVLKDVYVGTNAATAASMRDQSFRITYLANPSVGLPRELYLGDATSGHVREGRNTIVVFADTYGSPNGVWDPGEPYGIVRDVDVSWKGTSAEIELTDISPIMPRVNLLENDESDRTETDRAETITKLKTELRNDVAAEFFGQGQALTNALAALQWLDTNKTTPTKLADGNPQPVRVRIVRWLVNDIPVYRADAPMRVVYDKMIPTDVKTSLTEADVLRDGVYDLDWEYLRSEIIDSERVQAACGGPVTSMRYLVVIGDGPAEWTSVNANGYTVSALDTLVTRYYTASRTVPVALSPGDDNEVVVAASPTFRWSIDAEDITGYTAFKIQVQNAQGKTVYDSGVQPLPSRLRDNDGSLSYEWRAPLFVGDKTTLGYVFENKTNYTWRVSAYNAKFTSDAFSSPRRFYMNVQTNGYATGKADVAVKYFGPKKVWSRGETVRVRAFESPDFSGVPVAGTFVANPADEETGLNVTGRVICANCTVMGLPKGQYYLQAFIDSNNNGICDRWETQGYLCTRDGTTADYLNPVSISFDTAVGAGDLATIYLEDADTDMDGLPDAWEYAMYGNLTTKGVELLGQTAAGEAVVYSNLVANSEFSLFATRSEVAAGLAARVMDKLGNAGTLALALGADVSRASSFNEAINGLLSDELVEEGVTIDRLEMLDGKVVISVSAATGASAARASALSSVLETGGRAFQVTCDVYRKANLSDPTWTLVKSAPIMAGASDASEIVLDVPVAEGGFYKVEVHK